MYGLMSADSVAGRSGDGLNLSAPSGGSHVGDPAYGHYVTNHAGGRFWVGNDGSTTAVGGDPSYAGGLAAVDKLGQITGMSSQEMLYLSLASVPGGGGQGFAEGIRAIWEHQDRARMIAMREKMNSLRESQMSHQEAMDAWRQTVGNKQLSDREAVSAWNEKIQQSRLDFMSHEAAIKDPYTQEQLSIGQYKLGELAKQAGAYGPGYRQYGSAAELQRLYTGQ